MNLKAPFESVFFIRINAYARRDLKSTTRSLSYSLYYPVSRPKYGTFSDSIHRLRGTEHNEILSNSKKLEEKIRFGIWLHIIMNGLLIFRHACCSFEMQFSPESYYTVTKKRTENRVWRVWTTKKKYIYIISSLRGRQTAKETV